MKTVPLLFAIVFASALYGKGIVLGISNGTSASSTQVLFSDKASTGFDKKTDLLLPESPKKNKTSLFTCDANGQGMYVNYCPMPAECLSIPVVISVKDTGWFDVSMEDINDDLSDYCFTLTEMTTQQLLTLSPGSTNLLFFHTSDLNAEKKFMLNIFHSPKIHSTPVSCMNEKNGTVYVQFTTSCNWLAKLRNENGLVARIPSKTDEVLLEGIPSGDYFVEGWINNIRIWSEPVLIAAPASLFPAFTLSSDTLKTGEFVFTENHSSGGFHCYWEFGAEQTAAGFSPSCAFKNPGTVNVSLTICDPAGCTATASQTVVVLPAEKESGAVIQRIE